MRDHPHTMAESTPGPQPASRDDDPPAAGVLDQLPASRPGRRSARRASGGPRPRTGRATAARPGTAAGPQAGAATTQAKAAKAGPATAKATSKKAKAATPAAARATSGKAAKAKAGPPADAAPRPKVPRAGWATPEPERSGGEQAVRDVVAVVSAAAGLGESLVRGVLRRITPR